jgi:hypothetical protein
MVFAGLSDARSSLSCNHYSYIHTRLRDRRAHSLPLSNLFPCCPISMRHSRPRLRCNSSPGMLPPRPFPACGFCSSATPVYSPTGVLELLSGIVYFDRRRRGIYCTVSQYYWIPDRQADTWSPISAERTHTCLPRDVPLPRSQM